MAIVTYEWYADKFPNGIIPDYNSFVAQLTEAEAFVNRITSGRINEGTDAVKNAICAVAEVIYKQAQDDAPTVSSESVGNHSKSYTRKTVSTAEREAEKARKARLYLFGTGLLYRGLR